MTFLWPGLLLLARPARPAAGRRLRLEPAPRGGRRRPLLEPVAHPRGPARRRRACGGTCRSRCSRRRSRRWRSRSAARSRRQRAGQPDHDRPGHRRVGQHVLDRHRPDPAPGRRGRRGRAFIEHQGSGTQIGIVAFSGFAAGRPAADQRPEGARSTRSGSLTTGRRTAIGSGILAAIDAIAEVDPTCPGEHRRRPARASSRRRSPKGAYVPDIIVAPHRRRQQRRHRPARSGPAGRRPRRPRLHDRVRDGGRRRSSTRSARQQFIGREPAGAAASGSVAAAFGGGGRRRVPARHRRADAAGRSPSLTGGDYYPAESADQLEQVFARPADELITKHEVVELSVGFVASGALLAAVALLLGAPGARCRSVIARASPRRGPRATVARATERIVSSCHRGATIGENRAISSFRGVPVARGCAVHRSATGRGTARPRSSPHKPPITGSERSWGRRGRLTVPAAARSAPVIDRAPGRAVDDLRVENVRCRRWPDQSRIALPIRGTTSSAASAAPENDDRWASPAGVSAHACRRQRTLRGGLADLAERLAGAAGPGVAVARQHPGGLEASSAVQRRQRGRGVQRERRQARPGSPVSTLRVVIASPRKSAPTAGTYTATAARRVPRQRDHVREPGKSSVASPATGVDLGDRLGAQAPFARPRPENPRKVRASPAPSRCPAS